MTERKGGKADSARGQSASADAPEVRAPVAPKEAAEPVAAESPVLRDDPDALAGSCAGSVPDDASLRRVLTETAPLARRYLFGVCGDWDEAEDLTQEAMLKAWQKRASFNGRSDVRTWIYAIVRNHWLDCLRRRKTAPKVQEMTAELMVADHAPGPLAQTASKELSRAVEHAMGKLPPEQREALALRESDGLTFVQIGEMLNLPAATVKSRVRYALLKLAAELQAFRGQA